jgi:hypothetical protein
MQNAVVVAAVEQVNAVMDIIDGNLRLIGVPVVEHLVGDPVNAVT